MSSTFLRNFLTDVKRLVCYARQWSSDFAYHILLKGGKSLHANWRKKSSVSGSLATDELNECVHLVKE